MLQVAVLKADTELVKNRLAVKNFKDLHLVDEIVKLDDERKKVQALFDATQAKINTASKEIGMLMAKGDKEAAEQNKKIVTDLKNDLEPLKASMEMLESEVHNLLVQLPNLPTAEVPIGKTPEHNDVVRMTGSIPVRSTNLLPHWELAKKYRLIDFELGNKVTGSGFPFYIGKGAKLQRALIQFFLEYNIAAGYEEYLPPFMVNEASGFGTGQLPDKEGQMYYMPEDKYYMIPTAEVPVTNVFRDELLKEQELPKKMTAYSPCFRREAGSYGKDVRGLNRLHQFEKVEIIQIVHPDKSAATLLEMVAHVEQLLVLLQLPYRILRLCGGDMGFASAITYDFEVYSAAQERWLEVSSVSNFESYQANRMKCRFKDENGKSQLVHTLNGSALALPRIVATLLENHQTNTGIAIPTALQPFFGAEEIC